MAHRKTAIAVPEEILEEVDRAARERGESRSRFISRVLRLTVRARRDAEVTRRLNALFADPARREEHTALGIDWSSERW
jgi:metal-responsive CopG/Arc/MetJ family transcriptional regulator